MSAVTASLCSTLMFVLFVSADMKTITAESGQPVKGPGTPINSTNSVVDPPDQKNITAESGQDVTLTCRAPNNSIIVVEWSRADLRDKHVLLYRDGHLIPDDQHPSFKNRVDLQDKQMKDGNMSLILKDVTINDAGTYECRVFMEETLSWKNISIIHLHVVPPDPKIITAESGQNVTLTCRPPNNNIISLEWSRADLRDKHVLLYRDGQFTPDDQHPSFKNRVDLQDRQMKDGDVSLILKDVTINDAGTYECHGFMAETDSWISISIIHLHVVPPPAQTGGQEKDEDNKDGGKEDRGKEDGSVGLKVGLSVPAVLLVAGVVGFLIYKRCKQNPADPHVAEHLQHEDPVIVIAEPVQDVTLTRRLLNFCCRKNKKKLIL